MTTAHVDVEPLAFIGLLLLALVLASVPAATWRRIRVSLALVLGFAGCGCSAGLTAGEGAALQAADTVACSALAFVPVVGPFLLAACPEEEQLVAGAIAAAEHPAAPDAGAAVAFLPYDGGTGPTVTSGRQISSDAGLPVGLSTVAHPDPVVPQPGDTPVTLCARVWRAPLYHRRGRTRRMVGCAPIERVAAAQAYLDARAER